MKRLPLLMLSVVALAFFTFPSQSMAASSTSIESYIRSICAKTSPIDDCRQYDGEVTDARYKIMRIIDILERQSATDQHAIVTSLLSMLGRAYDSATGVKKFLAAYYYVSLLDVVDTNVGSDDLFAYLFGSTGSYSYSYGSYDNDSYSTSDADGGEIVRVLSDNSYTTVDSSRERIIARSGMLALRVKTEDERGRDASPSYGYRLVAMFDDSRYDDEVYGANYENSGYREFKFASQFSSSDEVTFYLLCSHCSGGTRFNRGNTFENRKVMDRVTYDLEYRSTVSSRYYDDYRYRYNSRYDDDYYGSRYDEDLGIVEVDYDYEIYGNEVQIELTTTVRNYGDDTTRLDELEYDIEVDNRIISSSRYDYRHLETRCDRYSDRNRDKDIDIYEGDECDITVRFDFDRDDVEDERVEIEVRINARGDDRSSNDTETISFYVN